MRQERLNSFCWFCHAYRSYSSIEDVFSIQGKCGKVTFHYYIDVVLPSVCSVPIDSSREGHDQQRDERTWSFIAGPEVVLEYHMFSISFIKNSYDFKLIDRIPSTSSTILQHCGL